MNSPLNSSLSRHSFSSLALLLLVAILVALPASSAAAGDPTLSDEERTRVIDLLAESRAHFLSLLAATSDAQWAWKPNEERWSVGECAEHILRSNEALLQAARNAMASPMNPEWESQTKGKAQLLLQVMPNRMAGGQGGASAPMEIRPTGEIGRAEIVQRFNALHDDIAGWIQETGEPLQAHTEEHPFPIFGTLSAYDWLLYIPLHTTRHSKQMEEVMQTEGFPDS